MLSVCTGRMVATTDIQANKPARTVAEVTTAQKVVRKQEPMFDNVEKSLIALMVISLAVMVMNLRTLAGDYQVLPGWYTYSGEWHQIYGARIPPGRIIWHNKQYNEQNQHVVPEWSLNPTKVEPTTDKLPYGWVADSSNFVPAGGLLEAMAGYTPFANKYTDTVTGAVSDRFPIGFQQEKKFKEVYTRTRSRLRKIMNSQLWGAVASIVERRSQGKQLKPGQIELALAKVKSASATVMADIMRITIDPIILERNGQEPNDEELNYVIAVIRLICKLRTTTFPRGNVDLHLDPRTMTGERKQSGGKTSVLVIISSRNDWYHVDPPALVDLPFWAKNVGDLVTGGPCIQEGDAAMSPTSTTYGFATAEVALAAWIKYFLPDFRVEVMDSCTQLQRVSEPGYLDSFDLVALYHSPDHALLINNQSHVFGVPTFAPVGPFAFTEAIEGTKAHVYPSGFWNFNNNKSRLQNILRDANLPWIESQWFRVPEGSFSGFVDKTIDFLDHSGWGCMLLKASYSSYSENMLKLCGKPPSNSSTDTLVKKALKRWVNDKLNDGPQILSRENASSKLRDLSENLPTDVDILHPGRRSKLAKYISHIKLTQPDNAAGWPVDFTAFKFVESFKRHFQLRTYWFSGGMYHLAADKADLISETTFEEWSWLKSQGGTIDDDSVPLDKLRIIGKKALKAIRDAAPADQRLPESFKHMPASRVDFGCCLPRSDPHWADAEGWFINEIEPLSCQLLDLAKRQIMRKRGVTGFGSEPNFRFFPQMYAEMRRAIANWAPVTALYALEMAELAQAARDERIRK